MTLEEVARRAGVSTATVARVIHSNGYVAEETRERVEAVLKATGYRPNAMARGLRKQRSFTFGHMLVEITYNPFYAHVARSVESAALAAGYKTFSYNHNQNAEIERIGVERFIERRVDAMLLTYAVDAANVELLRAAGIPIVQIERERTLGTHSVLVDSAVGINQAMRHLFDLGHRRIAFVGGDPELYPHPGLRPRSVEEQRLEAYLEALRNAGISPDPDLVRLGLYFNFADSGSGVEGYLHTQALLKLRHPPTAILAGCDVLAVGVLQALYEAHLRVPNDVSVIGFDDTIAMRLAPPLTSVAQPMAELGREAVRLALTAIDVPDSRPATVTLPTKLIIRKSTGSPPNSPARRA
jgi:DNA-binding LacI/PurR family transcriptional regulator